MHINKCICSICIVYLVDSSRSSSGSDGTSSILVKVGGKNNFKLNFLDISKEENLINNKNKNNFSFIIQ